MLMNTNGLLHHIEIYVSNLEDTTNFWKWLLTEKFTYLLFQQWEYGISFKIDDTYLVFVQTEQKYLQNKYNRKNIGLNHLAFHCDSSEFVDMLTQDLLDKNIKILYDDKHPFAGGDNYYAVYFEDPDRIKVEVIFSK